MIKKILITGGGGYVGSALADELVESGYKATVIDLFIYGEDVFKNKSKINSIKGDIRNQNLLNKIIKFKLPKLSFIIIFLFKAIPVLPFSWVIIYTSATDFSAKKFLLANMAGCLTTIALFANLGNAILTNNFFQLIIISLLFFILFTISFLFRKYYLKK